MQDIEKMKMEANYCLNCKHKPCTEGCPIHTRIPEFISKIKENYLEEAYNILQENNILSSICSRVCYQSNQCEGNCVRGIKGEPVSIGKLEQFVNDWAKENKVNMVEEQTFSEGHSLMGKAHSTYKEENNKIKIAVIGSGPAGLACSNELNKAGCRVTVFEKERELGGILRYGIPDFRLPKHLIDEITDKLKNEGIEFKTEIEFGVDIDIDSLKESGYEAIFIGIGARNSDTYKLAESESNRIYTSKYFLKRYNEYREKTKGTFNGEDSKETCVIQDLGITVVVGGGNVAIDCARTALKMGASESYILYRRNKESMPASEEELHIAIKEGVGIIYLTKINEFDEEKRIIKCNKIKIEDGKVIDIPESDFTMKADNVVFAIGLYPDETLLKNMGLKMNEKLLYTDENGMTNIEGVFAGGDIMQKRTTVVKAILTGKKAAKNILKWRSKWIKDQLVF